MSKVSSTLVCAAALVGCVTVNIYFPAEEVKAAADQIVKDVWGGEGTATPTPTTSSSPGPLSWLGNIFTAEVAHADQDINVSTPQIRAIKDSIRSRAGSLKGAMDAGQIGLGSDGLLKLRDPNLALKDRARLTQLINAENADREQLYREISKANGFPDKAGDVKRIFAGSWKNEAQSGWYVEGPGGNWSKK